MAKKEIMYQRLYNNKDLSGELKMAQDIMGAGTWDLSDKSKEISMEVAGMIGMEALAIAAGAITAG